MMPGCPGLFAQNVNFKSEEQKYLRTQEIMLNTWLDYGTGGMVFELRHFIM